MKLLLLLTLLISCNEQTKVNKDPLLSAEDKAVMEKLDDQTLLGPDQNNDGVRDDVEYWINKHAKDVNVKHASMMYVKYFQLGLKNVDDREKCNEMTHKRLDYHSCILHLMDFDKARDYLDKMNKVLINTRLRIKKRMLITSHFGGEARGGSIPSGPQDVCPFKLK
jgi:hypothetical protein|tara:strand:- start:236 stop:733 length:498 start_codon:yes stop_codon:yes gene_type:complete